MEPVGWVVLGVVVVVAVTELAPRVHVSAPLLLVLVGVAVTLFGWLPRVAVALTWGLLAALWFVMLIGDALHLPHWVLDVLPFSATPYMPLNLMHWTPVVVMTAVAALLVWAGVDRFARRDVVPG